MTPRHELEIQVRDVLAPVLRALNPIGRNLLGDRVGRVSSSLLSGRHLSALGRRVPLRGGGLGCNLAEAYVVLAADLGVPGVRGWRNARRLRELVVTAASTLLVLGVVDPAEDDPIWSRPSGT